MNLKRHIPNAFTCGNLICGCLAIIQVFEGQLSTAAYLVGMALIFDFFDGFMARLLRVPSSIGKDLDSLADMVTFGVVPGLVMYKLLSGIVYPSQMFPSCVPYFAFLIPLFSCVRLAKFNNDTRQSNSFIGLPTPSNAMVICSIPLISKFQGQPAILLNPYFLCLLSLIMSLLLVAEIPLFALKFKSFRWPDNKLRFTFLALSLILLATLQFVAIPLIILLYILVSIVNNIFSKKKV